MAEKGIAVFTAGGEDYTINDPNIAEEFSASKIYRAGDYAYYKGTLHRFIKKHDAGAWVAADAVKADLSVEVHELKSHEEEAINIFSYFGVVRGAINSSGVIVDLDVESTDFLNAEAETEYMVFAGGSLLSMLVIAFYSDKDTFISRLTYPDDTTYQFTTPANTKYIRVTTRATTFPEKMMITKKILLPYINNKTLKDYNLATDADIIDLRIKTNGIESVLDEIEVYYGINSSNKWSTDTKIKHIMLPVKENDSITVIANNNNTAIALLQSALYERGGDPDFVYEYDLKENDVGEQWWEIREDDQGNPIRKTRTQVNAHKAVSLKAVPDSKYLYITTKYRALDTDPYTDGLPRIIINNVEYTKTVETEETGYSTVFFDDFDSVDENVWTFHTEDPPDRNPVYRSRFLTDENNVRAEQSMLVMKIGKDNSGNNGTYIDENGNVQNIVYLAPYISTCESFAIPSGRISARIKTSKQIGKKFFMWCFWTFGQNNAWGYAHEMDIIENLQTRFASDQTSKSGETIPAGSIRNAFGFNLHAKNAQGVMVDKANYRLITIAKNNSGTIGNDEMFYESNGEPFDTSEWHTYMVEWDESSITCFIDDEAFCSYDASAIGAADGRGNTGFMYPQDIRFNIKCREAESDDEGYLFVDWVKAEALNKTPCLSISHDNVSLAVNGTAYIDPVFNTGCTNKAYTLETEDTQVIEIKRFNSQASAMVINQIKGLAAGTATVTMKSANGKIEGTFTVTVS